METDGERSICRTILDLRRTPLGVFLCEEVRLPLKAPQPFWILSNCVQ